MKKKHPRSEAMKVAGELCRLIMPQCATKPDGTAWLAVAGSLRRRRPEVSDIEIVYVPKLQEVKGGLFPDDVLVLSKVDLLLDDLLQKGILEKRLNSRGAEMWGDSNKLAVHVKSGIPVDLFRTTERSYWNYLVCRTGSAANNIRIANEAKKMGLRWMPYGEGFRNGRGDVIAVSSERQVFEITRLPYLQPWERQ